ncbi:MAG: hemolysin family protein [Clostridia bacterium]|nr:hemolysin family protein [Clostridia bacterium]MDD4542205.1 hemolysin family protein [Clostridia bacterium]
MDSESIKSIVVIGILIVFSSYFSASETAFSSLSRIRVKGMAEKGSKRANLVLVLYDNYDKLLSTILIGNNIVNIALTAIATVLFVRYFGSKGTTIATVVITLVVLIFGEISPKSLAKETPEKFAMFSARFLSVLTLLMAPLNFVFFKWKKLLSKIFKSTDNQAITESELLMFVEEAEQEGAINKEDKQLINNVIEFNDIKAIDILTPRVDVVAVSINSTIDEITELFLQTGYSRIPVYKNSIDNMLGFIHIRDFFSLTQRAKNIEDILSPVLFVTPHIKISELLKKFQVEKEHMAVAIDEYGGTVGILTMEDILEELVGEIWDEHDEIEEKFVKLDDYRYRISCNADTREMMRLFGLDDEYEETTVSGWVINQIGVIPKVKDTFTYKNLYVTVSKVFRQRVMEIIVENKNM